jgi:hypothetical protein
MPCCITPAHGAKATTYRPATAGRARPPAPPSRSGRRPGASGAPRRAGGGGMATRRAARQALALPPLTRPPAQVERAPCAPLVEHQPHHRLVRQLLQRPLLRVPPHRWQAVASTRRIRAGTAVIAAALAISTRGGRQTRGRTDQRAPLVGLAPQRTAGTAARPASRISPARRVGGSDGTACRPGSKLKRGILLLHIASLPRASWANQRHQKA